MVLHAVSATLFPQLLERVRGESLRVRGESLRVRGESLHPREEQRPRARGTDGPTAKTPEPLARVLLSRRVH